MNPDQPLEFLGGLTPREFMRDYWQKKPLFVPNAVPGFQGTLEADELAGLACEELADSRIVLHDPQQHSWSLRRGPFSEQDFASLPEQDWTLLVTDVDKWHADTEALLHLIDFIPRWRVDDIMISYATPGGSVGPHVDQYDVFLLQGPGQRRWQIAAPPDQPPALLAEHELAILADFQPQQEWIAQAGDLLYLPPNVPHFGVALEPCMTWSLGMRAPALADLLQGFVDQISEQLPPDALLSDKNLQPATDPWALESTQIEQIQQTLQQMLQLSKTQRVTWLGRWLTGNPNQWASPAEQETNPDQLSQHLKQGQSLYRAPWVRVLWHDRYFFIAGEAYPLPESEARALCHTSTIDQELWQQMSSESHTLLAHLLTQGWYALGAP